MKRRLAAAVALMVLAAACDQKNGATSAGGGDDFPVVVIGSVQSLLESNASIVGVLNRVEPPYVYASFRDGWLEWSTDPDRRSLIRGRADTYNRPDMKCMGFEYKRLSSPGRAERYFVCEAIGTVKVSNALPRSQDFIFPSGALFLQYEPPKEIGYPQYYFLGLQK